MYHNTINYSVYKNESLSLSKLSVYFNESVFLAISSITIYIKLGSKQFHASEIICSFIFHINACAIFLQNIIKVLHRIIQSFNMTIIINQLQGVLNMMNNWMPGISKQHDYHMTYNPLIYLKWLAIHFNFVESRRFVFLQLFRSIKLHLPTMSRVICLCHLVIRQPNLNYHVIIPAQKYNNHLNVT